MPDLFKAAPLTGRRLEFSRLLTLAGQAVKFGLVGGAATFVHVAVFLALVELLHADPLLANAGAFLVAFAVSFTGHFWWTFHPGAGLRPRPWGSALRRFVGVACTGFALNTAAVFLVTDVLRINYAYAVAFMLTVVPLCLFLMSRLWAFSPANGEPVAGPVAE